MHLNLKIRRFSFIPTELQIIFIPSQLYPPILTHRMQSRIVRLQQIRGVLRCDLGVMLVSNLQFDKHITKLVQKVREDTNIFKNLAHIGDRPRIKTMYIMLCQLVIRYYITIWGGIPKMRILELKRSQRVILKVTQLKSRICPRKDSGLTFRYQTVVCCFFHLATAYSDIFYS